MIDRLVGAFRCFIAFHEKAAPRLGNPEFLEGAVAIYGCVIDQRRTTHD